MANGIYSIKVPVYSIFCKSPKRWYPFSYEQNISLKAQHIRMLLVVAIYVGKAYVTKKGFLREIRIPLRSLINANQIECIKNACYSASSCLVHEIN